VASLAGQPHLARACLGQHGRDPLAVVMHENIPTLHRCAEFGALHVHHGQLPFPELERF
jgi:hypothetical protein